MDSTTVKEILGLCMGLTRKGNDTFFDYAPHTDRIYISIYDGKWEEDKPCRRIEVVDYGAPTYDTVNPDAACAILRALLGGSDGKRD